MVSGKDGHKVVAVVRCEQAVEEKGAAVAAGADVADELEDRRLGDSVEDVDCTINGGP
jgi:putative NADH-flavin reductase